MLPASKNWVMTTEVVCQVGEFCLGKGCFSLLIRERHTPPSAARVVWEFVTGTAEESPPCSFL